MSIASAAWDSVTGKNTLQTEVREVLASGTSDCTLPIICSEVQIFKKEANEKQLSLTPEASKIFQKTVNNIINDISRICREVTGKSIVCTSRKEATYDAREPKPRKVAAKTETRDVGTIRTVHDSTDILETVETFTKHHPTVVLGILAQKMGRERLGKEVVELLKRMAAEDMPEGS